MTQDACSCGRAERDRYQFRQRRSCRPVYRNESRSWGKSASCSRPSDLCIVSRVESAYATVCRERQSSPTRSRSEISCMPSTNPPVRHRVSAYLQPQDMPQHALLRVSRPTSSLLMSTWCCDLGSVQPFARANNAADSRPARQVQVLYASTTHSHCQMLGSIVYTRSTSLSAYLRFPVISTRPPRAFFRGGSLSVCVRMFRSGSLIVGVGGFFSLADLLRRIGNL